MVHLKGKHISLNNVASIRKQICFNSVPSIRKQVWLNNVRAIWKQMWIHRKQIWLNSAADSVASIGKQFWFVHLKENKSKWTVLLSYENKCCHNRETNLHTRRESRIEERCIHKRQIWLKNDAHRDHLIQKILFNSV